MGVVREGEGKRGKGGGIEEQVVRVVWLYRILNQRQGGQPNDHSPCRRRRLHNLDTQPNVNLPRFGGGVGNRMPVTARSDRLVFSKFSSCGFFNDMLYAALFICFIPDSHECIFKCPFAVFVDPT